MSELKVKSTVRPRSLVIAAAVINAANEIKLDVDMLITSGNDSKHMKNSKHYSDNALDFRSHHLDVDNCQRLMKIIRRRLGKAYQVILENLMKPNEHIHIEYDPN
jgi:hypothetical protein